MKHRTVKKPGFQPTALIAAALLLLILFLSAAYFVVIPTGPLSADRASTLAELEQQRTRWSESQPAEFEYRLTRRCVGCNESLEVTASDGVLRAAFADSRSPDDRELPPTIAIDEVFEVLEDAVRRADAVSVRYHPRYHFPAEVSIDWHAGATDDEVSYLVERFVALEP